MTTVYVSHRSALVAYLVAVSLQAYYRHRRLRIVIVELPAKRARAGDNRPFCGASTVSNLRMARWPFLLRVILARVLKHAVVFADLVQVHEEVGQKAPQPELPFWAHNKRVVARESGLEAFLAVFYLPQVVEAAAHAFLAENPAVLFVSVSSAANVPGLIENMANTRHADGPAVWFHFAPGDVDNRAVDLDVVASSRLCRMEMNQNENRQYGNRQYGNRQYGNRQYGNLQHQNRQHENLQYGNRQYGNRQYGNRQHENRQDGNLQYGNLQHQNRQHENRHYENRQRHYQNHQRQYGHHHGLYRLHLWSFSPGMATSILWLPLFKGAANMFSEPIFGHHMHKSPKFVSMTVSPLNLNENEEAFAANHDLLYSLKTCDVVLEAMENLLGLDMTPPRL